MNNIHAMYVHIPFCEHICGYCDFYKIIYNKKCVDDFLISLKREISSYSINHKMKTIYIGGGTPTSLSDEQLDLLLSYFDEFCSDDMEYTIEANPESLSKEKLLIMKKHHVNRLSIGVQSTDDTILAFINRFHTFDDVKRCVKEAREVGFDNISFDLILGLPHVSKRTLLRDVDNILMLEPEHISCYSLTIHEHTRFHALKYVERSSDYIRKLYDSVNKKLEDNGYIHYEISNWAKEGRESKHNFTYWKDEEYYGFGPGASGYIHPKRYTNAINIKKYNEGIYDKTEEIVTPEDDYVYFIMLNLRTNQGIDYDVFEKRFGYRLEEKQKKIIEKHIKNKNLKVKENHLIPTYKGMMILDQIILDFIQ